jgi:hypothetical protein
MASNPSVNDVPEEQEGELVQVFGTSDEAEALIVQGLLNSAGIESLRTNLDAPQDVLPGVGGIVLRVRASQAEEARSLIEQQRNAPETPEESRGEVA